MEDSNRHASDIVTASPIDPNAPSRRGRAWHNASLNTKVTMLVAVGAAAGGAIGITAAFHHPGHGMWVLSLGLTCLIIGLRRLGRWWVWQPYEELLDATQHLVNGTDGEGLDRLPVTRRDEVGQLACHLHELASSSIRYRRKVRMARRTVDTRVAEATRKATRQLRRVAMRDSLTNLGNRRFLNETLEPLIRTIRSADTDLACLLIDVDNFKQLNDAQGHAAGDEMLVLLARQAPTTI